MNKFLLVFNDGRNSVGLKTEHQVRTYLQRSVPDVSRVALYQLSGEAVRDAWTLPITKTSPKEIALAPRKNMPWTEKETLKALTMRKRGVPCAVIAQELGRTLSAVYSRIHAYAP